MNRKLEVNLLFIEYMLILEYKVGMSNNSTTQYNREKVSKSNPPKAIVYAYSHKNVTDWNN